MIFSKAALDDLVRLRAFIADHNPVAAQKISKRMRGAINSLVDAPMIGRPVEGIPGEIRELIFGRYGVRAIKFEERHCIYSKFGMVKRIDEITCPPLYLEGKSSLPAQKT